MKRKNENNDIQIGELIELYDPLELDLFTSEDGIVVFIEVDPDTPHVKHVYLKSEDKSKNILKDPRFEDFYRVITISNE